MGPEMHLKIRRCRNPPEDLLKEAHKQLRGKGKVNALVASLSN